MKIKKWVPVVVFLLLTVFAGAALAEGNIAKIGSNEYATFDAALAAAQDGDTIVLLQDAVTDTGINLSKKLTVDGGATTKYKLSFASKGIALWSGSSLTFQNCKVEMKGIGTTPYVAEWNWMGISASNAELNLTNAQMTMDGTGITNSGTHGIYMSNSGKVNLTNSRLEIRNYPQDALEWNGGKGKYFFTLEDSTFIAENNRTGLAGTFGVKAKNSTFQVVNNNGNGSNGSYFDFDNCKVEFNNNGGHGISANDLTLKASTLNAKNNGIDGVTFSGNGSFINSKVTITGTIGNYIGARWGTYSAGMSVRSNAVGSIDAKTTLTIEDNMATGLLLMEGSSMTIAEGAQVSILRNIADQRNCTTKDELAQTGGGVRVGKNASATLNSTASIYNNHALLAGDDLYVENGGVISFGKTGSGWKLDGEPDCTDAITGWFDDAKDARWEAHASDDKNHIVLVDAGAYEAPLALKAAHGILPAPAITADVPKTGDNTPLYALYALLALSLSAALVLTLRRKAHR